MTIDTKQIAGILKVIAKVQTSKYHTRAFSECFDFNQALKFCYPYLLHPAYKDELQEVYNHIIAQ
jgi:hypothetical protein